jgi:FkbM family methyltransferase
MREAYKNSIKDVLRNFDIALVRQSTYERMTVEKQRRDIGLLHALPEQHAHRLLACFLKSPSQLGQDLFVLSELNFKRGGFFVDFGATDGVELSNSCLLEKEFGWTGILSEPARCWHESLRQNRKCHIETDCVWTKSGAHLTFSEVGSAAHSTISAFEDKDLHARRRRDHRRYDVTTISLIDMLRKYDAPHEIDYLSIDTEGSEYEILRSFDFDAYDIGIITCEHNHTPDRERIQALLAQHGYARKFEAFSEFDDWYVRTR